MTEFERLCEKQREIILKGPESIGTALYEETDKEVEALLFCLEEYLDPFYRRKLPFEEEIWKLLMVYSNSKSDPCIVEEAKRMIEEYMPDK